MNELQSVTDIDEVIKYAERRAEGCHQMASSYHTDEGVYLQEETRLMYRAILWENIHEWLEELKELRKKARPHGEWIPHTYTDKRTGEKVNFTIGSIVMMTCSVCNKDAFAGGNFCPNCGADMRKEGDEK